MYLKLERVEFVPFGMSYQIILRDEKIDQVFVVHLSDDLFENFVRNLKSGKNKIASYNFWIDPRHLSKITEVAQLQLNEGRRTSYEYFRSKLYPRRKAV